jgi:molecular chaperone HscA
MMDTSEARILLKNLLKRVRPQEDGSGLLPGTITEDEIDALRLALQALGGLGEPPGPRLVEPSPKPRVIDVEPLPAEFPDTPVEPSMSRAHEAQVLDLSCLSLPAAPSGRRVCIDFGTAMSKVTLVSDETADRPYEEIEVLKLGRPGDQEEISEEMLVSSVYIDNEGRLWFGAQAVQRSQPEGLDGKRQRIDNVKRYLSEEGFTDQVARQFNPTKVAITYRDMILAYLTFLTWAMNRCLDDMGYERNILRRFAMPCFDGAKSRRTAQALKRMLFEAQILADTFATRIAHGIELAEFVASAVAAGKVDAAVGFIDKAVTEPLGVAGSLLSWKTAANSLVMVVDVGAGTSDFSLFRLGFNEATEKAAAVEVENSARGLTEAGNHLDNLLKSFVLRKAGVESSHDLWINILGALQLNLRDYKEALFNDGFVSVSLFNGDVVEVTLEEFLALDQVASFSASLRTCMKEILASVDASFIAGAPNGRLAVALTGGGAALPMVRDLAEGEVEVNGKTLRLVRATSFPAWMSETYPDLEDLYPRVAVSLGGARKRVIDHGGSVRITAGDVKAPPKLEGYYVKGH